MRPAIRCREERPPVPLFLVWLREKLGAVPASLSDGREMRPSVPSSREYAEKSSPLYQHEGNRGRSVGTEGAFYRRSEREGGTEGAFYRRSERGGGTEGGISRRRCEQAGTGNHISRRRCEQAGTGNHISRRHQKQSSTGDCISRRRCEQSGTGVVFLGTQPEKPVQTPALLGAARSCATRVRRCPASRGIR